MHPDRAVTLVAAEPVIVLADDGRLRQVIDNLLSNAVKHTPDGAPVTVTVTSSAGRGELSVADAGPGLTQDQAARVFERFYRTDGDRGRARGGTGLGLAIAASLTAAHGGRIDVDTAPGRGATFSVASRWRGCDLFAVAWIVDHLMAVRRPAADEPARQPQRDRKPCSLDCT